MFGTFYDKAGDHRKSPTVFNLGYTEEVARQYPHVARLSGGVGRDTRASATATDGGPLRARARARPKDPS